MVGLSLYKLTGIYQELMELASSEPDDIPVGFDQQWFETMEQLQGDIDEKLVGCCKVYKSLDALQDAIQHEIDELRLRRTRIENAAAKLKDYVKFNLEQIGDKKRIAGPFTLSICNNSQPSVIVLDLDAVPAKFDKPYERQVSLTAIRDALKAGEEVPGVDVERGTHLRIK